MQPALNTLSFRMSIIPQHATVRTTDQRESRCLDFVKQEFDENLAVKDEPVWEECTSDKFQNVSDESKNIIDQVIDGNGKVLLREHLFIDWNDHTFKSEENTDSIGGNESTCTILKLEPENNLMDQEVEMSSNFQYIKLESHQILKNEIESTTNREIDSNDLISKMTSPCEVDDNYFQENIDLAQFEVGLRNYQSELKNRNCHFCDFKSTCISSLRLHLDSAHLKLRGQKCQHCGYNAVRKNHLQKLIDSANLKQNEDICQCSRISTVELKLKKQHLCDYCDYIANSRTDLRNHMNVHLKRKSYKCHLCEFKASQMRQLRKHRNYVHLKVKPHQCHLCNYRSSLKRTLRHHINAVHLKLKNFKCHFCDYKSYHKYDLKVHIDAVHLKIKNHKCKFCDYNASVKGSLRQHMKFVHLKSSIH